MMFKLVISVIALVALFSTVHGDRVLDSRCPEVENEDDIVVILPNPDDCSSFFKCDHGSLAPMSCPDGLLFNDEFKVCDWPDNVNCIEDGENTTPEILLN